jgi:hypothetical protein
MRRALAAILAPVAAFVLSIAVSSAALAAGGPRPSWSELSTQQKEALAPLESGWDRLDPVAKQKWLTVAKRYPQLTPEAQRHIQERMPKLAGMSVEQRRTSRENFRRAYELPMDQRQALVQQYRDLPAERKKELAEQARRKPDTPRKPTRAGKAGERAP